MTKQHLIDQVAEIIRRHNSPFNSKLVGGWAANAADKIVELIQPEPDTSKDVPIAKFVGEVIELRIRYGCGSSNVFGRVRLVEGGSGCPTVYWIGEAHVPEDATLYHSTVGDEWIFDAEGYNEKAIHVNLAARYRAHPDVNSPEYLKAQAEIAEQAIRDIPEEAVVARIHDETIVDAEKLVNRAYEDTPNARPMTAEQIRKDQVNEAMDGRR